MGYAERPVGAPLADLATCVWVARGDVGPVVPDGCTDLLWDGARLSVAGPDRRWWVPPQPASGFVVGLRLPPGSGPALLGVPASALVDERPGLAELWGPLDRWTDALAAARRPADAAAVLERLALERRARAGEPDPAVLAAVAGARRWRGPGLVRALSRSTGFGERQLLRRFERAVGYGPKRLHRVLRFQRFLGRLAASPDADLAGAAVEAGYADQAHLTRDAVELSGRTPAQLRERARRLRGADDRNVQDAG
ncbi:helix-turn-helix domain-containing protein [Geodermatophilus sp. URMC 64]